MSRELARYARQYGDSHAAIPNVKAELEKEGVQLRVIGERERLPIDIEDRDDCARFTGVVLTGLRDVATPIEVPAERKRRL